jgi:UPF0716 protein FxsA
VAVIFGAAFLITPGFITDIFGLALLLPPTRALLLSVVRKRLAGRMAARVAQGPVPGSGPGPGRGPGPGYDVEGTASEQPSTPPPRLEQ